jgi:competence ComEA-like helix-hairpin-helix protein
VSEPRTSPKMLESPLVGLVVLVVAAILCDSARTIRECVSDSCSSHLEAKGGCFYQVIEDGALVRSAFSAQPEELSGILAAAGVTEKLTRTDGSPRMPCDRVVKFDSASQFFTVERIPGALLLAASRRIDINNADESDLIAVPGIGPRTAEKIVRHREQAGAFSCLDDLLRIPGIGKKKLAAFTPYLEIRGADPVPEIQDTDRR